MTKAASSRYREADVMRRRSGLVGGERQTLEEIGDEYGVSRERIRQLETRARDRLKVVLAGGAPEPRGRKRRRKPPEEVREPEQTEQTAVPDPPKPKPEPKPEPKPKASPATASKSGVPEGQGTLF